MLSGAHENLGHQYATEMADDRITGHMSSHDRPWDKVLINDLTVDAILGILPEERVQAQRVVINLTIFTDTQPAAKSQNIADTVNYAELSSGGPVNC